MTVFFALDEKRDGLVIVLARALITSLHFHEEEPSWCLSVYQECTPGAIGMVYGYEASLDCLRVTAVVGERLCASARRRVLLPSASPWSPVMSLSTPDVF